jgi:hypothetical protein
LANLDQILKSTLLLTADPNLKPVRAFDPPPLAPMPPSDLAALADDSAVEERAQKRIWEYSLNGLNQVRKVTVRNRLANDQRATVCDWITWGPVRVTSEGKRLDLPLTEKYLLRTYFLRTGLVPESNSGFWQLKTNLHSSFQHVFGYQMDLSSGRLVPIKKEHLDHPHLMNPHREEAFSPLRVDGGKTLRVHVAPLRIIVVVTLGCAGERKDFEPGGVMGAARILPTFMVMANLPVDSIETAVTLERPPTSAQCHMDGERMTERTYPALFTDCNSGSKVSMAPYWSQIFDYYDANPPAGTTFKAVRRGYVGQRRDDLLQIYDDPTRHGRLDTYVDLLKSKPPNLYTTRPVQKMDGQGEFDNLHIAPRMIAPDKYLQAHPDWKLDEIVMAPFCLHDCLHTHWRWGLQLEEKWIRGWGGTADSPGLPHQRFGGPMVPPNQDVQITLLDAPGFKYEAKATNPRPSEWQVFMHHGSAYAISVSKWKGGGGAIFAQLGNPDHLGEPLALQWSLFYWALRYKRLGDVSVEQTHLTLDSLRALRSL